MSYCVSSMIGIRTGGVFSGPVDIRTLKGDIQALILDMKKEAGIKGEYAPVFGEEGRDPVHSMSHELQGGKGSYVVLAGVFNNWEFDDVERFAERLSYRLDLEVLVITWDEEQNIVQGGVYRNGVPLKQGESNGLRTVLRRVAG